ncbi:MAG TPA: hypothetical protein DCZ40_05990, partial [Lachnospiraceae bacterium]|nr:hypothetical protein [Lachnospiraceae bacterium]
KLFVIGNGFDIAHGLPTKYSDFQNYLLENYPEASDDCLVVPESFIMPDGEESYNDIEVVSFLLKIITESEATGEAWSDLENTLGKLNLDGCFDDWNLYDNDDNEWHEVYRNEDIAANVCGAVQMIKKYFSNWVETIDVFKAKTKTNFSRLIEPDKDFFLTFNYTETLEHLYGVKNIFHIHGKQGGKLVFGHGNNIDYYDKYMDSHVGSESYLSELQLALKKDTQSIIKQNKKLFKEIGKVGQIYSYGFSFSEVDMVYIRELCKESKTENMVWYFNSYDKDKFEIFKEELVKCGFKGKFDIFTI